MYTCVDVFWGVESMLRVARRLPYLVRIGFLIERAFLSIMVGVENPEAKKFTKLQANVCGFLSSSFSFFFPIKKIPPKKKKT
jgi:hypothetical protein